MSQKAWDELIERYRELRDLHGVLALLEYDQQVFMPPEGAGARASVSATVEGLRHERLTDPRLGDLLDTLEGDDSLDEDQRSSVRVLRRDYDRATKVPPDLVKALAECRTLAYQVWTRAKPANDFSMMQPQLEQMIRLKFEEADALGWEAERYDALLDEFEPGMTTREVELMFTDLVDGLRPLADAILGAAPERPSFLSGSYDEGKQKAFCDWLVGVLGFDGRAGRLDVSPHPFTLFIGVGDTRQTTRTETRSLLNPIYAAIHETGHALYEQGIPTGMRDLPIGDVPSLGIHESQSRFWENQVGRSRAFCDFMLPQLKDRFDELGTISPNDFHRAANHAQRSLIRVFADEVTYNLHIAHRFEIELALFRGELAVADLPDAWDEAIEKHVGIRPESRTDGVLQDMHWSIGGLGYFPTYTLGTLYASAFYARAREDLPDLDDDLRRGETGGLLDWLGGNVFTHGYRYPAKELGERVIGGPLTAKPFLGYLRTKYESIYDLRG